MTHYCFNQEIPFELFLDADNFNFIESLKFMRSRVLKEMPLDAPQIRVTWKWWIRPHCRNEGLPTIAAIQYAIGGIHRWEEWQTVRIEVRADVVVDERDRGRNFSSNYWNNPINSPDARRFRVPRTEERDRMWREEVNRRVFRPEPLIEDLRSNCRGTTGGGFSIASSSEEEETFLLQVLERFVGLPVTPTLISQIEEALSHRLGFRVRAFVNAQGDFFYRVRPQYAVSHTFTTVPNAEHLENQSRLKSCCFNARSPHLKCAVNPTVECRECTHYEAQPNA
jgi:Family of unknown function (DUF6464)